jgi:hypothetical protein
MTKRTREPSVEFDMMNGFVVLKYGGKKYAWFPPDDVAYNNFLNDPTFECSIIHNSFGQAMFNVENLRICEDVLRQEINPLDKKDVNEWVVDEE